MTVYQQIAEKLGIDRPRKGERRRVSKPTTFITNQSVEDKVDVILVDEAHLLWTQGKQAYGGSNMLSDLLDRAKVVVAVFDKNQVLRTSQYWDDQTSERLSAHITDSVKLSNQMRMNASPSTVNWIRAIIDERKIHPYVRDDSYDLQIFDSLRDMHERIKYYASSTERGLSRLISTFDWEYKDKGRPENYPFWGVDVEGERIPWNYELKNTLTPAERRRIRNQAWAEQEHTIDEVGSTFTIQGFDLNYAGVIIGPSVKYRDGSVVFDPAASKNKGATQRRTMSDGTRRLLGPELIKNELNVLLTRGVHGLYIYAVDPQLREALHQAVNGA